MWSAAVYFAITASASEEREEEEAAGPVMTNNAPVPITKPTAAIVTATSVHNTPLFVCQNPLSVRVTRSDGEGPRRATQLSHFNPAHDIVLKSECK